MPQKPHTSTRPTRRFNADSRRPKRPQGSRTPQVKPMTALEKAFAEQVDEAVPTRTFAELRLPQKLVTGLERRGITQAFPIQAKTLPDALAGRDVLGRAQTGSGKTLAFGLPLLARLMDGRSTAGSPRGLVLVPTRELAKQVHDALEPLAHGVGMRLAAVYGGASMYRQVQSLRRGVDVVVATPGRLLDLMRQGECKLGAIEITVLDEADFMADLGFLPDVRTLLTATRADGQRMLFSATLDRGVDALVHEYLTEPVIHAVAPAVAPVSSMDHRAFVLTREDKVRVIARIAGRPARTLIFVRTKHGADRLAKQLRTGGAEAIAIHGDLTQGARQRALSDFSDGRSRVLVATDVAARGLHVDNLDLVVHYDPPADSKDYLHRSGRTARAGASGLVLSLLQSDQRRTAERLFSDAGVNVKLQPVGPDAEVVSEIAASGEVVVPVPAAAETEPNRRKPRTGSDGWRPRGNRDYSKGRRSEGGGRPDSGRSDNRRGSGRPGNRRPRTDETSSAA